MNSINTQHLGTRDFCRKIAVAIALSTALSLNFPASAQRQQRITSVWTSTSSVGSTVHVVSNTTVGDYEAYTRGGRFYVKIPFADLPSARGSLLGRGFDDVQIQRYGDGIIISFHLLPGTSARVQQGENRLDVIFTVPGKANVAPTPPVEEAKTTPTPPPPGFPTAAEIRTGRRRWNRSKTTGARSDSTASAVPTEANKPSPGEVGVATPSGTPGASPSSSTAVAEASPTGSPAPSGSVEPTSVALQSSPLQQAPASTTAAPTSEQSQNHQAWRDRLNYWKAWATVNWIPLFIGILVIVLLLILFSFWRGVRRIKEEEGEGWPVEEIDEPVEAKQLPPSDTGIISPQTNAASASAGANQHHAASGKPSGEANPEGTDPDREVFEL